MTDRVTQADLEAAVDRLNRTTGNPANAYTRDEDGNVRSVPGVFVTDYAYGGVALYQVANDRGGLRNVLHSGHVPKRELLALIHAYLAALEDIKAKKIKV